VTVPTFVDGSPATQEALVFALTVPYCHAWTAGTISLADSTITTIDHTMERYPNDSGGMHSTTVNPSRITVVTPGEYELLAQVAWETSAVGARFATIRKNGTDTLGRLQVAASPSGGTIGLVAAEDSAVAGDYYEVTMLQNTGDVLAVRTGLSNTWFSVKWIRAT